MAHWFHRNPIKATQQAKFELKNVLTNETASKICGELRLRRVALLDHIESASTDLTEVETEFQQYLALLYGFVYEMNSNTRGSKQSKLRYLQRFIWAHSMMGTEAIELSDAWYEALNICLNMAIWYMKKAAWISAKDSILDSDAKTIHTCLRRAAGIFNFIFTNLDKLEGIYDFPGCDLDPNVVQCYTNQCEAEAQEIAIARAIELKHSPKLISDLAAETAQKYQIAGKLIEKLPVNFERWRCYLHLKHNLYKSYAYAYFGEALLSEDKCGEAIRACKEGINCYKLTEEFCEKYAKSSGPGFLAQPEKHLFFRKVEPLLRRHLEKAERENSMIYHQKVLEECPLLDGKTTFGLATPEIFNYPTPAELWSLASYVAFDITKSIMPDFGKARRSAKSLPPVKEEKLYETDKDPNNSSGCTIS